MKLASSPEQNSVDTQQAQLSMGRLKRLAAQRYVTPYELSRNILQEAGYEITRREEKTPLGHRGYDVLFPCSIEGQQHQKRMRRSWLIKLEPLSARIVVFILACVVDLNNEAHKDWIFCAQIVFN